jgi:RNA polymerase sigma factor (sigma-70 family)
MLSRSYEEERILVQNCLAGDQSALITLQRDYLRPLRKILLLRGADDVQADDIVANLWADCVVGRPGRQPLLTKYSGLSNLRNWLFRVGVNALLDLVRQSQRQTELVGFSSLNVSSGDYLADAPAPEAPPESGLTALLRECLEQAFRQCPADDLLRLRLFYVHGVTQRELARMWGRHESTIGRDLSRALQLIADQTLQEIRRLDPKLKLSWDDFLALCQTDQLDFL